MALILRYAVRSDLGLVRGNNEDSVYAGPRLLAIADGMGGHAAGEVASKIVIGTLEPLDDDRTPRDLMAALRDSVLEANQRIADAVEQDSKLDGMGTTLTALRFVGSQVGLVHVGDSRAYLLRNELLAQITHDDTYVQYLVDTGKLTPDEAIGHPRKSVILRALRGAEVDPDVSIREARAGDRYLLCSDGLSDVVSTDTIAETLRIADVQECADRLVELALRSGGPDNVTVIVADVVNAKPGDVIDDLPVVAGAFVDPSAADIPGRDTPAERASHIGRVNLKPAPIAAVSRRGRIRWKVPVTVLAVLAVIAAVLGGTYAWAQTQYYVGRAGGEVAIYRGVHTSFGPLKFSDVYENTDLKLDDLNPSWRGQVESGITANNKRDAENIVVRLHDERACPPRTTPTTPASSPSSASSPPSRSASKTSAGSTTASPPASRNRSRSSSLRTRPISVPNAAIPGSALTRASAARSGATTATGTNPSATAPATDSPTPSGSASTPGCR